MTNPITAHISSTPCAIILRGLSGSGKSTAARAVRQAFADLNVVTVSADDYPRLYAEDGSLNFHLLAQAHDWCFAKFADACRRMHVDACGFDLPDVVVVDNTNTTLAEMSPYRMIARMHGVPVQFIHVDSGLDDEALAERNKHGVPVQAIAGMRARWQELPPFWEDEVVFNNLPLHGGKVEARG